MISGKQLRVDGPLLLGILMLLVVSLFVIFSAGGEDWGLLRRQGLRILVSLIVLLLLAQVSPNTLRRWSPYIYFVGTGALVLVLALGYTARGAQSWLDLGFIRFQPSEIMKLAVPMTVAWILTRQPMPPTVSRVSLAVILTLLPAALVLVQPDFGTAVLLVISGVLVIFLAGIRWHHLLIMAAAIAAAAPYLWNQLHNYQQQRIVTMFNPWVDPLGSGYHIIQSQIAIGSAGVAGKGWLAGTQSQLEFIPERSTDFIFAVFSEEFGLIGVVVLLVLYLFVVGRSLLLAYTIRDSYSRLLAGGLALTFFFYLFVNIGMVTGVLPVVGIPLPLISYGGTSMVTLMAAFGMIMGAYRHRPLLN